MLIIGCGDVGRRVARRYFLAGTPVTGLVLTPRSAETLESQGIRPLCVDLDRPPLPTLPPDRERVFYFAPPPESGTEDPRMAHVLHALRRDGGVRRLVYISTTGVYGDCRGEWVDEGRELSPGADRARRRLDAEAQVRAWSRATGAEAVILRVAGIYGPERLPLARIRQAMPLVRSEESPFTNRIHVEDLAEVCAAAMEQPVAGEIFNVSDGHPGTMAEYFDAVADLYGLPRPPKIPMAEAAARLSPGMLSYMQESRRLSNEKMRRLLGVELRYPSLREGLASCDPGALTG